MVDIEQLEDIKARNAEKILSIDGITGIGIGLLNGSQEIGIIVYHEISVSTAYKLIPEHIEGAKVEIRIGSFKNPLIASVENAAIVQMPIEQPTAPNIFTSNPREKLIEPMIGGISVNPDFFYISPWVGTLGLVVKNNTGQPVIMSNRHVICGKKPKAGDGVSQPALNFTGDLAASLIDWELGNFTYNGVDFGMDAAVALPTNNRSATIGAIYALPNIIGSAVPSMNLNVKKSGLMTDVTSGRVTGINFDVKKTDTGLILKNQIIIKSLAGDFSKAGDSGSAIIDDKNNVIALLWGGNDETQESVASPIGPILNRFNCTVT